MTVPMDFPALVKEIQSLPTVEAGIVTLMVRLRNAIEQAAPVASRAPGATTSDDEQSPNQWLAGQMDAYSALLADAVVASTPAAEPSAQHAAQVQRQADQGQPNANGG